MSDFANPVLIWTVIGIVLMVAELIIPGGIVVFLGAACLIVGAGWQLGWVTSWVVAMTVWFITSIVLLIVFRNITQKLVGGEITMANTEEDVDVFGQSAVVTETIGPGEKPGRITFQDSSWQALSDGGIIHQGETVTIVCRDNIALIVEKSLGAKIKTGQSSHPI